MGVVQIPVLSVTTTVVVSFSIPVAPATRTRIRDSFCSDVQPFSQFSIAKTVVQVVFARSLTEHKVTLLT